MEINQQRYAQLEKLYSSGQWAELEASVGEWLQEKDLASWRPRLLLLMGHSRLYGSQDPAGAADFYDQVLASSSGEQASLWREIATAGLSDCQKAMPVPKADGLAPISQPNPNETDELAKGLLRVVIEANPPQQQLPN
ncbi:hypothetical protein [Cyanobium sp. WAJ14-Wanaka]|uniref:hypothetical protein n=1 Tax=Cyanobium sp. WAJ14-Wanaka TaxID=2823725 RepID=UPI0020CE9B7F|nr:hypothetical protein [Cyanobium sp. WAJ14-Wanaka]MCP9775612.1 hypothetical protein [Cyanobium sp. WAJ14-Wanaka]